MKEIQCLLAKGTRRSVSFITEKDAKVDKSVKYLGEDGWTILEVYSNTTIK